MIVYEGVGPEKDTVVGEDVAFSYALERVRNGSREEQEEFVEWFFSGNRTKKEDGDA